MLNKVFSFNSGAEKSNYAIMFTRVVKELRKRTMVVTGYKSLVTGSWPKLVPRLAVPGVP